MKLIIGLGNPDKEYKTTRHNAGWMALDYLVKTWGFPLFKEEKKFSSLISSGKIERNKITLAKPTTFMNESGIAARALMNFYKIAPTEIIIVHDDKDIPLGEIRAQFDRGPAGHNGVKSVIEHVGTKAFARIRVGIAPTEPKKIGVTSNFVLRDFSAEEQKTLSLVWDNIKKEVEKIILSPQNV